MSPASTNLLPIMAAMAPTFNNDNYYTSQRVIIQTKTIVRKKFIVNEMNQICSNLQQKQAGQGWNGTPFPKQIQKNELIHDCFFRFWNIRSKSS